MSDLELTNVESVDGEIHMAMMRTVLDEFMKRGFVNIRANLEGMVIPEKIGDYTPDLTCNMRDRQREFVILEVETCNTMNQPESEKKWRIFHKKSKETSGEFHLAVPKFCGNDSGRAVASQKLEDLQIKADYVWAVNGSLQRFSMQPKSEN